MHHQVRNLLERLAARDVDPLAHEAAQLLDYAVQTETSAIMEACKDQVLILLVKDAGGKVAIPVQRIDTEPNRYLLKLRLTNNQRALEFTTERKQRGQSNG